MKHSIIRAVDAPQPIGPYSQAVAVGDLIFLSGQIALDPASGAMAGTTVEEQTRQVMRNIRAVLAAAGLGVTAVVRTMVFLTDLDHFAAFNGEYEKEMGEHRPARSLVIVKELPKQALVEVECTAAR